MKWLQIIKSNGKKDYILIESVKWFGQEVKEVLDKKGNFKTFQKKLWVKNDKKHYLDSKYLLKDIRKLFPNYDVQIREHRKSRNGKLRKAISRVYEVLIEGVTKVYSDDHDMIVTSIDKKTLFTLKGETYYCIFDCFFRQTDSDEYVYYQAEKQFLYNTGILISPDTKKEHLIDFKNKVVGEIK